MTATWPRRETAWVATTSEWTSFLPHLTDLRPRSRHVLGMPVLLDGERNGLIVENYQHYPPTYYRVLVCAGDCELLAPGDLCRIKPYAFDTIDTVDGRWFTALDERRVLAVVTDR